MKGIEKVSEGGKGFRTLADLVRCAREEAGQALERDPVLVVVPPGHMGEKRNDRAVLPVDRRGEDGAVSRERASHASCRSTGRASVGGPGTDAKSCPC